MRPGGYGIARRLAVLLAAGAFFISCAKVLPPTAPPVPEGPAKIQGALEPAGIDVSLEGAEIRAGGVKAVAGAGGVFRIHDLPPGKNFVVAEKRLPSGPVRRAMGMAVIFVGDNPISIKVKMRDATDIDAFCEDCHPYRGKKSRKDQILRCVHISRTVPKKATGWKEGTDASGRVTCESCHTLHEPAPSPHFLVATTDKGELCRRCHR